MSVDFRTRSDSVLKDIEPEAFFTDTLPKLLTSSHALIDPWLNYKKPDDLTLECDGVYWHLAWAQDQIIIERTAGSSGLHVKLNTEEFSGLVNDLYTPMTFFVGGTLDIPRGDLGDFLDWWLLIRAVVDQRPIHVPGEMDFNDRDGKALDLQRNFSIDHPLEDMRHFLETAGFLHIRGVFSEQEMAQISSDMDTYQDQYREGDNKSWWATVEGGERRLVRMQGFDTFSQPTAQLLDDPRVAVLGSITGAGHVHRGLENNRIEALIKPLNVVQGISDLPWHKDCSLGRHSYECCSLTVGISVTGAGPDSGQLRVIAGSHRALMWPSLIADPSEYGLPVIDLPTKTGDITIHLSCTHHMAQAPSAHERRVMYTSFQLPSVEIDSSNAARARINQVREAAYKNVSQ